MTTTMSYMALRAVDTAFEAAIVRIFDNTLMQPVPSDVGMPVTRFRRGLENAKRARAEAIVAVNDIFGDSP